MSLFLIFVNKAAGPVYPNCAHKGAKTGLLFII